MVLKVVRAIESAPRCLRKGELLRGHKIMEKERGYLYR